MSNRKLKMTTAVILTLAVIVSSSLSSFAAISFSDIGKTSPYKTALEKLVGLKVINGYEDGTFKPENNITRAETCIVISKSMNPSEAKYSLAGQNSFSDVGSNYSWAEKYINYAARMEAVNGYPDGTFKPANNVTYNELSAMILKAMGYSASELTGNWPDNFKNKAISLGLYDDIYKTLSEEEKASFDYQAQATRGNTVLMVNKAIADLQKRGTAEFPEKQENAGKYDWITGDTVTLTLADSVRIMQTTGYLAEIAKKNKESDEAKVIGYGDSISDISDAISTLKKLQSSKTEIESNQSKLDSGIAYTKGLIADLEAAAAENPEAAAQLPALKASLAEQQKTAESLASALTQVESALDQMPTKKTLETNKKLVELQKKFAKENTAKNYEASMNGIESQTLTIYYGVLQAQKNIEVCKENVALQEKLLKQVNTKYSLGMVTKAQVTSQEATVNSAKQKLSEANAALESAKMNFNMLLGYEVKTNLVFKDSIEPLAFPSISIENAVTRAMNNRLSVAQMEYAVEVQKLSLELLEKTEGKKSGAYKQQQAALDMTQLAYDNMPKTLEIEIRSAYIDMKDKYQAIQEAKDTLGLAQEGLRTMQVMYKTGMKTATDVQQSEYTVHQTEQLVMAKTAAYNQAVYNFKYLMGVGTERIDL